MTVLHLKGGNIVCTCVDDSIIKAKEKCKEILLPESYYKSFKAEEGGGVIEGIYGYPCLNNRIEFCPTDWEEQLGKINECFCENNCYQKKMIRTQAVRIFSEKHILGMYWVHYFSDYLRK